ncbi:hypothetical protein Tco_1173349 [Tanacetum coccineum]
MLSSFLRSIIIPFPLSLELEGYVSCGTLNSLGSCTTTPLALGLVVVAVVATVVWICQISQENDQKRTRERMSDQEAKESRARVRTQPEITAGSARHSQRKKQRSQRSK